MIEENQQHHWIQHVKFYKEQLKFFQLQKKLTFVGQCNYFMSLRLSQRMRAADVSAQTYGVVSKLFVACAINLYTGKRMRAEDVYA